MKKNILTPIFIIIFSVCINIIILKSNIQYPDFEFMPWGKYGFAFDTTCIAGKIKSISVGDSYKGTYKKMSIKFDGPWYYYDTSNGALDPTIINVPKEVAMKWFESNQIYQWNYFTKNYKKHGSGWQRVNNGNGADTTVDGWELTLVTDPKINLYELQGKFIMHQFSCLWKQKKMGEFGSEYNIKQSRVEVK